MSGEERSYLEGFARVAWRSLLPLCVEYGPSRQGGEPVNPAEQLYQEARIVVQRVWMRWRAEGGVLVKRTAAKTYITNSASDLNPNNDPALIRFFTIAKTAERGPLLYNKLR